MALIEHFHVIADEIAINSSVTDMIEGMFAMLNSSGEVIKATGASGTRAIGCVADTKSTSTSGLPATNSSSQGAFVNRVSDSFDETRASGKMTVYHGGGRFSTNQYESVTFVPGEALYVSANAKLTNVASANSQVVGTCTKAAGAYDSGVPGIDVNGSLTLGNYVEFKLEI